MAGARLAGDISRPVINKSIALLSRRGGALHLRHFHNRTRGRAPGEPEREACEEDGAEEGRGEDAFHRPESGRACPEATRNGAVSSSILSAEPSAVDYQGDAQQDFQKQQDITQAHDGDGSSVLRPQVEVIESQIPSRMSVSVAEETIFTNTTRLPLRSLRNWRYDADVTWRATRADESRWT
ncbi:PREDICTED: uncharacterized protein LOC105558711 [Vollenhovia emeryi]|uniref:uncharacterized protein LOC105558711 n=1 Tax=Vollenhovia emeryi TaxID=411798 RepID=UPI0005F407B0|nr:PREDICTED: uncharacterized protein LOC105558711 [Vollenhovia emeryi]